MDCNSIHYRICDITKENKKIITNYIKRWLLDSGVYDNYRKKQKGIYYTLLLERMTNNCELNEFEQGYDFKFVVEQKAKYSYYRDLDLQLTDFELKTCERLFNNKRSRILRLKKKLKKYIYEYDCLFLTFTFRNKVLDTTTESTRRVYISRFLRDLIIPFYVANIDYGDLNEREHYHAIVATDFINPKLYKYGIIKIERIIKNDSSIKKISTYINKLSSHAFKDSTGQSRLIYSRKTIKRKSITKLNYDNN